MSRQVRNLVGSFNGITTTYYYYSLFQKLQATGQRRNRIGSAHPPIFRVELSISERRLLQLAVLRPSRMKGSKHVCESVPRVLPSKARFLVLICSTDRSTYRARVPYWTSRRAMADQSESFLRVRVQLVGLPAAAVACPIFARKSLPACKPLPAREAVSIAYFGIMSRKLCQSLRPKSVWPRPAPELTTRCHEAIAHLASKTDKERAHCAVLGHPNHPPTRG